MPHRLVVNPDRSLSIKHAETTALPEGTSRLRTVYSAVSHGSESLLLRGLAPRCHRVWNKDLRLFDGEADSNQSLSLGYETVGVIVETNGDERVREGDLLWLDAPHCDAHVVLPDAHYFRFPRDTNPKSIAFFALTRVALAAVHDLAPILGDRVVVVGAGVVGHLCCRLLQLAGASEIVLVDKSVDRLSKTIADGVTLVDARDRDVAKLIKATIGPADSAIDASGSYDGLETAIRSVSPMGKVIAVSSYGSQLPSASLGFEFHRNRITLISSMSTNDCAHPRSPAWNFSRLEEEAARLLISRLVDPARLITHEVPFLSAPASLGMLLSSDKSPLKILFRYD